MNEQMSIDEQAGSPKPLDKMPLGELRAEAEQCVSCGLSAGRKNVVFGRGGSAADLMFVGEAPGADEDEQGQPFVGRSGRLLQQLISEEMSLDINEALYITNIVKCRPPNNRPPSADEAATCRPWLERQIQLIAPKVIVTLGNSATKPILETETGITRMRGKVYVREGYKVVPTFHPSAILRDPNKEAFLRQDLVLAEMSLLSS